LEKKGKKKQNGRQKKTDRTLMSVVEALKNMGKEGKRADTGITQKKQDNASMDPPQFKKKKKRKG